MMLPLRLRDQQRIEDAHPLSPQALLGHIVAVVLLGQWATASNQHAEEYGQDEGTKPRE